MRKFFSVLTAIFLFLALIALCGNFMLYVITGPDFLELAISQLDRDTFALSLAEEMSREIPGVRVDLKVAGDLGDDLWRVLLSVSAYLRDDVPEVDWQIDYRGLKDMMLQQLGDEEVFTAFLTANGSDDALAILAAPEDQFKLAHEDFMQTVGEELSAIPDLMPLPVLLGGTVLSWNQGLEGAKEIMDIFKANFKVLIFTILGLILLQLLLAGDAALTRTGWTVFSAGLAVTALGLIARFLSTIGSGMPGLDMQSIFLAVNLVQLITGGALWALGLLLLLFGKIFPSAAQEETPY